MHSQTPPHQTQSPPFGYLSPPTDSSDAYSDDGDTLHTPLSEHHDSQHHPYAVYDQNQDPFAHPSFHSFCGNQPSSAFPDSTKSELEQSSLSSFSALLTSSTSDKLARSNHHTMDGFFSFSSPPSNALDLANASLEFNPFSASFGDYNGEASGASTSKQRFDSNAYPLPYSAQTQSNSSSYDLPPLTSLLDSMNTLGSPAEDHNMSSLLFSPADRPLFSRKNHSDSLFFLKARMYNPRFPADHTLNGEFVRTYELGDELGSGGYGFVMTALHRTEGFEVAVKFIIKNKVPEHAWWDDELLGRVPTEIMILSLVNHENVVKCLDLFDDDKYFYLVQELHGTPWVSRKSKKTKQLTAPGKLAAPSAVHLSPPCLTPSSSTESTVNSLPGTPPEVCIQTIDVNENSSNHMELDTSNLTFDPSSLFRNDDHESDLKANQLLRPHSAAEARPSFSRRPSYDLFECIEQSKHKRLSENQARYVFAQVVEAVYYLESQGITHCDIKDENLVIDSDLNVKLIDFGSAVVSDPAQPRPYYTLFFGTTAYAASEILLKKPYRAAPAEVWTLGVLLSYLLTGNSPFPTEQDAMDGNIIIREKPPTRLSRGALNLLASSYSNYRRLHLPIKIDSTMFKLCLYKTLPANASHFELMEFVKAHQSGMQCSVPGHIEETITIARRLNAGLPSTISGLPNELLCQIFVQYILMVVEADDADYDYFGSAYDFDRSADELPFGWMWWLILTRVCRRWRTITLSTPALWVNLNTRIYPKRPNILRKFFERSGALPLDIRVVLYLSPSPEEIRSPLRMVLRESSRIQSLVLKLPIISVDESITNELGGPFTQLQAVTVDAPWSSTDPERSPTSGLNLLPVIFTKMPQNLHTLRLSNVSVDWRSLTALPPTIIHLNLSQSLDRPLSHDVVHPDCTLDHVLDTLDNLPYLQELVLSSTLPQQLGSTRLVHLRHLKHLFLRESIPSCLVLFLCLAFPLTTEPRLMISLERGLDSDWDRHGFSMPSPFAHSMAIAPQDCAESATEMAISLRATYCNVEVNASACSVCKSSLVIPSAHGPWSKGWQRYRSCSKPHREKFTITDTVEQDDSSEKY
ncbi:hypothetical protein QCA50_004206 [Cerrena zonata]|uniref:Protein kinase domain-containing protein n=1 Tax=Cerrena zonata TaxID=2478898 RepID=A0AAW0GIH5_9APHY